jgi:GPI mannosyltransferase 4
MSILSRPLLTWTLYIILLIVRVLIAPFLPGYIHPDEFFQGGQELWFGSCPSTNDIPWEFQPQHALRSVVPPCTMTWIPLRLYSWMVAKSMENLSGMEVLVVPRLACSLVSIWLVDGSIWKLRQQSDSFDKNYSSALSEGVPLPVLLLASSWPTVVMLTRPFSNTMETFCLATLLQIVTLKCSVHTALDNASRKQSSGNFLFAVKVGITCAFGLFTRFTFVFFASPVLFFLFHRMVMTNQNGHLRFGQWKPLLWMTVSFMVVSILIIIVDTSYYQHHDAARSQLGLGLSVGSGQHLPFTSTRFVVTPLNAFRYNSQVSNLKEHGLHPLWTHCLVNMFILFGPLTLAAYISIFVRSTWWIGPQHATLKNSKGHELDNRPSYPQSWDYVSQAVILFGLAALSVAPHQEPRFLLPLLTPIILVGSTTLSGSGVWHYFVVLWIMFNLSLFTFFGVVHQAGVVHSLLAVGRNGSISIDRNQSLWIYWRTYMPPSFLTRVGGSEDASEQDTRIVDLNGSSLQTLLDTLEAELKCGEHLRRSQQSTNARLHLVAPYLTSVDSNRAFSFQGELQCTIPATLYDCKFLSTFGPHLTTEDFPSLDYASPSWYNSFLLGVYEISCK